MPDFVVDASVSAAWFLPDEATPETEAALAATARSDVWVPALWVLEMVNLMHGAQRRRRITAAKREELVAAAAALRLIIDREPVGVAPLDAVAARFDLSAYDAAYLELAIRRGLPLATLDARMQRAARAAQVRLALPTA